MSLNGTKFVTYGKNQELISCSTYRSDTGEDISTKRSKGLGCTAFKWLNLQQPHAKDCQQSQNHKLLDIPDVQNKRTINYVDIMEITSDSSPRLLLATMVAIKKIFNARFVKTKNPIWKELSYHKI